MMKIILILLVLGSGAAGYFINPAIGIQNKYITSLIFSGAAFLAAVFAFLLNKLTRKKVLSLIAGLFTGKFISLLVIEVINGFTVSTGIVRMLSDTFFITAAIVYFFQNPLSFKFFMSSSGVDIKKNNPDTSLYKVLDTSVIIDGRIADIVETRFLDGILVIPQFVLMELQQIADSAESIKRSRGRRGLDILNKMKLSDNCVIKISDTDFPEIPEVDSKLLELTMSLNGMIVTNDFNLNKIAELKGVKVLNINELTNALKPVVLPGEEMNVTVIKEGKDPNQGIAYLDDGTMIVVDKGRSYISQTIDVVVTSVFQTPAGRMIFTEPQK